MTGKSAKATKANGRVNGAGSGADPVVDPLLSRRDTLLIAAMNNVPFDGWTDRNLRNAAASVGEPAEALRELFPNGAFDAVAHLSDWADRRALAVMDEAGLDEMRVRDRITLGVRARLEALAPYKEAVRRSLAFLARPAHADAKTRMIWSTSDRIWEKAGDTATDYNRYTKRGLLSGVVTSTTLFWMNDESENHEESWAFLDRRIENVLSVGKRLGKAKGLLDRAQKVTEAPRRLINNVRGRFSTSAAG